MKNMNLWGWVCMVIDDIKSYLTRQDVYAAEDVNYWRRAASLRPDDDRCYYQLIIALERQKTIRKLIHDLWLLLNYPD